jgi:hypothetical protein
LTKDVRPAHSPPRKQWHDVMAFELDDFHRNIPDEDFIADLLRVAKQAGTRRITFREYNSVGKFSSQTIAVRFGSWLEALKRAGLEKTTERNIPNEQLFANIVRVWSRLGRQPKFRDLTSDLSDYGATTYASRFGGWRNALIEFIEWANARDLPLEPNEDPSSKIRKTPRSVNWRLRALVLMRDQARCRLCGASPADGAKLHVDHVKPWSRGGDTTLDNLQILCDRCNVGKGDIIG